MDREQLRATCRRFAETGSDEDMSAAWQAFLDLPLELWPPEHQLVGLPASGLWPDGITTGTIVALMPEADDPAIVEGKP